jgi:hypothetical protein
MDCRNRQTMTASPAKPGGLPLTLGVAVPAERMKAMRQRRRARGLRELRLVLPDARSATVRRRVAVQVAGLNRDGEAEALRWIETVSDFDEADDLGTP